MGHDADSRERGLFWLDIALGVGKLMRVKRRHIDCRLGKLLFNHSMNKFF